MMSIHPSIYSMYVCKGACSTAFWFDMFLSDKGIFTSMILTFVYVVFQG